MSSSPARVKVWMTLLVARTLTLPPGAQWQRYPSKNLPQTTDGKMDLDAPPRRTADGKA